MSPSFLFVSGLLLAPAVILQQDILIKAAQSILFLILAVISMSSGKRRLIIGSLIFVTTTIIVNAFSPVGRVVLRIGPLPITRGALLVGLSKATTLASLLYLSRFCVRPSVRLPGIVGRYLSDTLAYLTRMLARGKRLSGRNMVQRLDELFHSVYNEQRVDLYCPQTANSFGGVALLILLLALNWGSIFFPFSGLSAEG